jgi:hypothetical protein
MATIYSFPDKHVEEQSCKLSLYNDVEVEAVMACLNVFSTLEEKITPTNITAVDPTIARLCLEEGLKSWIFSNKFKDVFNTILGNSTRA